jgi:cytochrome c oxidase subunit 1
MHWLGAEGMPRRYADYLPSDGFTTLNMVSSIGAFVLGGSVLPFLWNVFRNYRYGEVVTVDDPWGYGNSLEWATSCPPPRHNFTELPRIRSERPAFQLHYPQMVNRMHAEEYTTGIGRKVLRDDSLMGVNDPAERTNDAQSLPSRVVRLVVGTAEVCSGGSGRNNEPGMGLPSAPSSFIRLGTGAPW